MMKPTISSIQLFFFGLALLLGPGQPDPEPLQDYCIADPQPSKSLFFNGVPCINPSSAVPSHFATSVLSKPGNAMTSMFGFNVTLTTAKNLPGMNTLGLTMARVDLAPEGVVPPHSHPRASEVTICREGEILVGFVDTSNRVYTQRLRVGESFVFPKGLAHFLFNLSPKNPAVAISGLNSQNPGAQMASLSAFASTPPVPDEVLKTAFQINGQDLKRIRRNLGG